MPTRKVSSRRPKARPPDTVVQAVGLRPRRRPPARWGVLIYLAGDTEAGHEAIREDLGEILEVGGSDAFRIAVQYDGPDGAVRHFIDAASTRAREPTVNMGRVDSGSAASLLDFLRWGMSVLHAERLALVYGSPTSIGIAGAGIGRDEDGVFVIGQDRSSGNMLDASELGGIIRAALAESGRERIDLFAIDSCHAQFLELAYELERLVHVLIAPQTTIPDSGWDYRRVLGRWKAFADAKTPGVTDLARALLDEIIECYAGPSCDASDPCAVSALDLHRLDDVARAFDTLCIGSLQSMGEGLIWESRRLLLGRLHRKLAVYDCGSFFSIWAACLESMATEAFQRWLGVTVSRTRGDRLDRFYDALARHLEADEASDDDRIGLVISMLRSPAHERESVGDAFLKTLSAGVVDRLNLLAAAEEERSADESLARAEHAARRREEVMVAAIEQAIRWLPQGYRYNLQRVRSAIVSARRLAQQAWHAKNVLIGDGTPDGTGMVIATRTEPAQQYGWPRWSGVSVFRPQELDELMSAGYQRFAFHARVHWAAMLGAANLIERHPRALWRLVSSLLASGAAGTRRDVLRRLTGEDSVMWGLREQFRAMAPAPTLTLSLERRNGARDAIAADPGAKREHYLLRLESITRGAVITEQESRVQPRVMDRALQELEQLLQRETLDAEAFAALRKIGGLLGEDIFQSLGHTLEVERDAARAESPDTTPHLQLQIPRELMRYPWELLHHRQEWIGERFAMGRQVYMETGLARRVPTRRPGRVRPLIIGDPLFDAHLEWRQLPGARDEAEQVAGWFEQIAREAGSIVEFERERDAHIHCRVTGADVRALLREGRYDIVHFAGHGMFRADDPETSAWLMSDGELWSLEIRNTLAEHGAPPWLVFANACEAGMDDSRAARRYQGNVFGLATAFINQGVAAYIAPLWRINDALARHIALEFYRNLLCERATLGEALRRAKASARQHAYGGSDREGAQAGSVWAGLGWASLVLYGDPTEELYQALAGGADRPSDWTMAASPAGSDARTHARRAQASVAADPQPPQPPVIAAPALLHAADHVLSEWVRGPNWRKIEGLAERSIVPVGKDELALELIEESGVRRWRIRASGTRGAGGGAGGGADGLPGSGIAALLADDRVRRMLPSERGIVRVIGRWVLSGFDAGIAGLVREYDREQVEHEGLLVADGARLRTATRESIALPADARRRRALVIIHGTFSKSASPVNGFGPAFMRWAREQYAAVLAFDHWTLSKSPEDNARQLVDELRALEPALLKGGALDLVCHSRGGLVARAFCDLLGYADAAKNIVFIGTPNCGTDLANPRNWSTFADLLVNMTGVDGAELYGRIAGLLAQFAARGLVDGIPGLLAQDPNSLAASGSLLKRLQNARIDRTRIRYSVVCAEFEPIPLIPNFKRIAQAALAVGTNALADALFASANDLVVNTAHAWGIGKNPAELATLPACVPPARVLVYHPRETRLELPAGVLSEVAVGVHHCNLFGQARAQESIKRWLAEP